MQLNRRLQILIDDERYERIASSARERGVSVATVVREALDRGISQPANRAAAGRRILAAPDMEVPDVPELREEVEALRSRRA